jgi:hypothetical protein
MASTILSDNGVTSGSAGLKTTAASDGALALQTTTAGGTATTALTIDTSQNVGIGTTSPDYKLHVVKPSAGITARFTDGDGITDVYGYGLEITRSTAYIKSSGALQLGGANGYNDLVINSSGNVGISGTPSAWGSSKALQLNGSTALWNFAGTNTYLSNNEYFNGTNRIFIANGWGTEYQQASGNHIWSTSSASGTAGGTVTNNEFMRLDTSGNLGIGRISPTARLHLTTASGNTAITLSTNNNDNANATLYNDATYLNMGSNFGTTGQKMKFALAMPDNSVTVDSSGNLLVNTTSQFAKISVVNGGGDVIGAQTLVNNGYSNFIGKNLSGTNTFVVSGGGSVTKTSGTFRIPHPIAEKAITHDLVHSFIEGPNADLIYRGKITLIAGKAQVNIDTEARMTDGTFVLLCRNVQCFTTNETDWTAVKGSVIGNILTIESQEPESTAEISWMVIGERQDKHMFETGWTDENGKPIIEPLKNQRNLDVEI